MNRWTYFKDDEVEGLEAELVAKLDLARGKSGVPFTITSGKRSLEDNRRASGVQDSSHLSGQAVDLACADDELRFKMLSALLAVGFTRLGVYDRHIHCDIDQTKKQNVAWIGISH